MIERKRKSEIERDRDHSENKRIEGDWKKESEGERERDHVRE